MVKQCSSGTHGALQQLQLRVETLKKVEPPSTKLNGIFIFFLIHVQPAALQTDRLFCCENYIINTPAPEE